MATDHATRQQKSNVRANELWNYPRPEKKRFNPSRDELKDLVDKFKGVGKCKLKTQ